MKQNEKHETFTKMIGFKNKNNDFIFLKTTCVNVSIFKQIIILLLDDFIYIILKQTILHTAKFISNILLIDVY